MGRFDYLDSKKADGKKKKKARKVRKPAPEERPKGETLERVEVVYIRKETVRAVWRQVKKDGGESVSELVEDLLLQWLRDRA